MKKSINYYIVKVENLTIDEFKTESGFTLKKHSGLMQGFDYTRTGRLIAPCAFDEFGILPDDILYFHHHIVGEEINNEGNREYSMYCIDSKEHLYKVHPSSVFAYERDGKFVPVGEYCWVTPEKEYKIDPKLFPNIELPNNEMESEHRATVRYSSEALKKKGILEGTKIWFLNEFSKYHFPVHDEKLYRMDLNDLIGIVE